MIQLKDIEARYETWTYVGIKAFNKTEINPDGKAVEVSLSLFHQFIRPLYRTRKKQYAALFTRDAQPKDGAKDYKESEEPKDDEF